MCYTNCETYSYLNSKICKWLSLLINTVFEFEKDSLIIGNCHHLLPTKKKFIAKHNYQNIIEPNETTSQKTLMPPELRYLQTLSHHQLKQTPDILLEKQKYLEGYTCCILCLFSVHNTISLSGHKQVCLIRLCFQRYLSHHWTM